MCVKCERTLVICLRSIGPCEKYICTTAHVAQRADLLCSTRTSLPQTVHSRPARDAALVGRWEGGGGGEGGDLLGGQLLRLGEGGGGGAKVDI